MDRKKKPYAVLIIDDDSPIRRIVKTQLGGGGYTVYEAENRVQVERVLDRVRLDAVICDIKIKDTDGFELTRRIRERFPGLPVIILTGLIERENAEIAHGLGCFDFLIKPVKREKLREVVGRAVGNRADAKPAGG